MAAPVTLDELQAWVKRMEHRTWSRQLMTDGKREFPSLEIKYIRFNFDTRDMKIFSVSTDNDRFKANWSEPYDGTVLDLLESRMQEKKR